MRLASFLLCLTLLLGATSDSLSRPADRQLADENTPQLIVRDGLVAPPPVSSKNAAAESLLVYGGPATLDGKFQDGVGQPDWQGWTTVDRTDTETFWHVSTYLAENLGAQGAGNHALWCGRDETQVSGWATAPGYGNDWIQDLIWSSGPLADPDSAQVVQLDFFFNHDLEPFYDFFSVAYDSAGTWVEVYEVDGRSPGSVGAFDAPGLRFSELAFRPLKFDADGYGGENGDEIVLRLQVFSDPFWSDEDGNWDTDGAVQVDNLLVSWRDGGTDHFSFEDFESAEPYAWVGRHQPYVGDFAKLFAQLTLPDPCSTNTSAVVTFIDDGTPPSNPSNDPPVSTGGSLPSFIHWSPPSYGLPGGWVVNYTDGLSGGQARLRNEIWSPPIVWDLPTAVDDGPQWVGGLLEYDLQDHLPFQNGIFHLWYVRSSSDGGTTWTAWEHDGFLQFTSTPQWYRARRDLTGLVPADATHVQIALGVQDYGDFFGFIGQGDATPGPWFDNVRLVKYSLPGPVMTVRDGRQFQDSFAQSGLTDVSTVQGRDALDVRLDIAETVGGYGGAVAGDSMVVAVESMLAGLDVDELRLHWILEENPVFESSLRGNRPADAALLPDSTEAGGARWRGTLVGSVPTLEGGEPLVNQRFFDFPDEDFFYPGDRIRYFVEAIDTGFNASLLPPDTTGFATGVGFDERFRVRALPTYQSDEGGQRKILIVDESGREDSHDSLRELFAEIAAPRNFHPFGGADTYVVRAASSAHPNGIGSAGMHGATLAQLGGYDRILYAAGRLSSTTLSDGSNTSGNDIGDDLGLLSAWHALAGNRGMAHLGTNLPTTLSSTAAGSAYLNAVLGAELVEVDLLDVLGQPSTVTVVPAGNYYVREFTLAVGCPSPRPIDWIETVVPGTKGHVFQGHEFDPYAASVVRLDPANKTVIPTTEDVALTFPFDLHAIVSTPEDTTPRGARKAFLEEIGRYLGYGRIADAVEPPPVAGLRAVRLFPNPANPRVWIHFVMGVQDRVEAEIFDVRGRKVRVLDVEILPPGPQRLGWDARDDRGQPVASGVYLVRLRTNGEERWNKVAIVK